MDHLIIELSEFVTGSGYKSFIGHVFLKCLLLVFCLSFHFLNCEFWSPKILNFDEVQFNNFFLFYGLCFWSFPNTRSWSFSFTYSSKSFIVLTPTFKYIIHFELILCMCEIRVNFIVLHIGIRFQLFHHYLLKNYHFLIELLYRKSVLLLLTFLLTMHYISLYFSFFYWIQNILDDTL